MLRGGRGGGRGREGVVVRLDLGRDEAEVRIEEEGGGGEVRVCKLDCLRPIVGGGGGDRGGEVVPVGLRRRVVESLSTWVFVDVLEEEGAECMLRTMEKLKKEKEGEGAAVPPSPSPTAPAAVPPFSSPTQPATSTPPTSSEPAPVQPPTPTNDSAAAATLLHPTTQTRRRKRRRRRKKKKKNVSPASSSSSVSSKARPCGPPTPSYSTLPPALH